MAARSQGMENAGHSLLTFPTNSWSDFFERESAKDYFAKLAAFLEKEYASAWREEIHPAPSMIFRAFELTPLEKTKVVILGQDPYHNPGQAEGLAFSVARGQKIPPSLRNIFKELEGEYDEFIAPQSGSLEKWAKEGVLLLNSILSVGKEGPLSHAGMGWETFTDRAIGEISEKTANVVFIFWGNGARKKSHLVDGSKHKVLKAAHPSPLSASRGFFGCGHFALANEYLESKGRLPVDWRLV